MTERCDHQATLQLLTNLEESEEYQTLLNAASPACQNFEALGDVESLRAASQVRFMMMKALALTDRREDAAKLFDETQAKFGSNPDKEILYWVFDASISMADLRWEMGRHELAMSMLQECVNRFRGDTHPALRRLSLQAATDLSICWFEDGDPERALSVLTDALVAHVSDTEVNVQEEFCRAANQRFHFLGQR